MKGQIKSHFLKCTERNEELGLFVDCLKQIESENRLILKTVILTVTNI